VRTLRMEPVLSGAIGFYRAELEVPQDAWGSDLVFVDTQDVSAGAWAGYVPQPIMQSQPSHGLLGAAP
jgi:hypothetical protein